MAKCAGKALSESFHLTTCPEHKSQQGYLRKLYGAGDDMSTLANAFDKDGKDKVMFYVCTGWVSRHLQ